MQANVANNASFFPTLFRVARTEGVAALYQGVIPTVCRASVLAAVEMSVFETAERLVRNALSASDDVISAAVVTIIAALIASFFSSLASSPWDVVRSRIMAQTRGRPANNDGDSKTSGENAASQDRGSDTSGLQRRIGHTKRRSSDKMVSVSTDSSKSETSIQDTEVEYAGVIDCMVRSVQADGLSVLWAGRRVATLMFIVLTYFSYRFRGTILTVRT
jgi:hypothetical protein